MSIPRLAIVTSHPIQYYAPWFRFLAASGRVELRVYYLWDFGVTERHDPAFERTLSWDIPLLDGYPYEFVPNTSRSPGSEHMSGLWNPTLPARLAAFSPETVLLIGYKAWSYLRVIFAGWPHKPPYRLIFRGDSHRLTPRPSNAREIVRRSLITTVYRRFDAVLYVGQANRDYFRWHDVRDARLFFAPHAIDQERFSAHPVERRQEALIWRRSLGIPDDTPLIVFAGKFTATKRPLDLLHAFATLKSFRKASLLFVGSGKLEAELRSVAQRVPGVYFAPFQNQTQMPRTYAAADLFVLPSGGETWGLAISEALALARPVIVSDQVGCARDLVVPGHNGLVFPAGNVPALTAALREALADPARLIQWGREGQILARRYSYAEAACGLFAAMESFDKHPHHPGQTQDSRSRPARTPRPVHFWFPALTGSTGGIQTYLQFLLQAFANDRPKTRACVFIKNDSPSTRSIRAPSLACRGFGQWRNGPIRTLVFATYLLWTAARQRPGLIIVGHVNFVRLAAWAHRLFGIPFWAIVYGVDVINPEAAPRAALLAHAQRIISISRYTRDHLIDAHRLPPGKFSLLPTTFDDRRFAPATGTRTWRESFDLRADARIVLTICRLSRSEGYKGYEEILRALPAVAQAVPQVHYVLGGEGDDVPRIRQLVASLGVSGLVTLAGFVPDEDLVACYQSCDVFAMPSRKEGFGIVFLEALACGRPVLAGNRDGSVDALLDGELGVLVDPGNREEIVTALIELLTGRHSHPLVYHPTELHRRVAAAYGPQSFGATLSNILAEFLPQDVA